MEKETELFFKKPNHRGDSIGWRESYWKLFFLHCSLSLLTHLCVQPHFCLDDQEHHVLQKMWIIRMIRGLGGGRRRGANEHHRLHWVRSVFPHQWVEPSPLHVDIYFFLCEETPVPKAISVVTLTLHHCLHGCIRGAGCGWSLQWRDRGHSWRRGWRCALVHASQR